MLIFSTIIASYQANMGQWLKNPLSFVGKRWSQKSNQLKSRLWHLISYYSTRKSLKRQKRDPRLPKGRRRGGIKKRTMRISVGGNRTKTGISYRIYSSNSSSSSLSTPKWRSWPRESSRNSNSRLTFHVFEGLSKRSFQSKRHISASTTPGTSLRTSKRMLKKWKSSK